MSTLGDMVTLTLAGESHGPAVAAILSGLPAGIPVDCGFIKAQLEKRRGIPEAATERREPDDFEILSGVFGGFTDGAPITVVIRNKDADSTAYEKDKIRPGHADYTAFCKYHGYQDYRGGGHFSGRISAAVVAAGAIAIYALRLLGISLGTHILRLGEVLDRPFSESEGLNDLMLLDKAEFAVLDAEAGERMKAAVSAAKAEGESLGGILETKIIGLPEGLGEPWFCGIEGEISRGIFGIPAVKGIEFGAGFGLAAMRGSEANDEFCLDDFNRIVTKTNNCGGVLGGISDGMPVIFRCAVKPTPSVAKEQKTVDMRTMEETKIKITGRHDPAIAARAAVIVDSVTAICLCNLYTKRFGNDWSVG